MMAFAVVLSVVVALMMSLRGEEPFPAVAEPESAETPPPPAEEPAEPVEPAAPERLPIPNDDWPEPSGEELGAVEGPRYYPPEQDAALTLTVGAIGLYDAPVLDSRSEAALERGVIHIPETPMPWDEREEKNVYLAGHRIGYPNTGSRLIFYNLDKLSNGDSITLEDRAGNVYAYRVTETFVVGPYDDWVMDTVLDRDIVTLQTCTPIPTFENRLIVRADRVASSSLG